MLKIWTEYTSQELRKIDKQNCIIAIVTGSCEQHARHLPLGTDTLLGEAMLKKSAEKSTKTIIMLPTLPYGFSRHHLDFEGSISLEQSELSSILITIFKTVSSYGFKNLFILNSHGGNSVSINYAVNELGAKFGIKAVFCKYWDFASEFIVSEWRESPVGGLGHAGEMETSLMMSLYDSMVRKDEINGYKLPLGGNKWFNADMFANNKIVMYNNFIKYSKDGNVGLPEYASAKKGTRLFEYCSDRIAEFLNGFWDDIEYI